MKNTKKNILIVGAGIAGRDVALEIKKNLRLGIHLVGFIDDQAKKLGKAIEGLMVLGTISQLTEIAKNTRTDEIIIAMPSAYGENISRIVRICSDAKLRFRIVPRVREIIEGKAQISTIRDVDVEDLLGRPVVKSDVEELKDFFDQKTVFVTGAAGSIGSELSRQICAYKPNVLVLYDWWENGMFNLKSELSKDFPHSTIHYIVGDIRDRKKIGRVMKYYAPHYVFHAAAYKHVPIMEENIDESVKNNIIGTLNVAEESGNNGVDKFIFVSTDKAANPISIMGITKYIAEDIVKNIKSKKTKYMIVRFGNVLDSMGSVIPIFKKQIREGGPVTITDPRMTRYFMTIPEAAQLILKAASIGRGGELFLLDMGKPIKIVDLAKNLIRLSGLRVEEDIRIVYTGKRKGEKLHEKLFTDREGLLATKKDKIYMIKKPECNIKNLPDIIIQLKEYAENGETEKIMKIFNDILKDH
ncbi:MAG: nucleoside-diphosphate sugar epimerase/dehydratase [Candidatus Levybacteria bacterium]|nr:nucleoside-diphosphate sugar epimerase/dehydratase [Candidatus Levybacteria bacterium]